MLRKIILFLILAGFSSSHCSLYAQEKPSQGMPPANVVVSEIGKGMISPETEFIGTVFYQEVSDVASEVSGKIEEVQFEEGQRVKRGEVLVRISYDLLEKTLQSTQAGYEQAMFEFEKEGKNLQRMENLYKEQLISEHLYDDQRFRVKGLEKKAASLKSEVERLEVEMHKKAVVAPFEGIVLKKHAVRGEWLSPGSAVATIGKDDLVDIITEVPEQIISYIKRGNEVKVNAGGKETSGKILSIVPKGDISTRTIPVKIRIRNASALIEGMEARVTLSTGQKEKAFTVPRDAVITVFGNTVVFIIKDSKAEMIPVKVVGYAGMTAGVNAEGLGEGMKVVIKGNERLRDGQAVTMQNGK